MSYSQNLYSVQDDQWKLGVESAKATHRRCKIVEWKSSSRGSRSSSEWKLNAAARLVFRPRCYNHMTDALAILHWLRLPERVNFKLALMPYWVMHGMAPEYLNQLVPVSDLPSHRRLHSSSILQLLVPPYPLITISRRSFPVAASIIWNSLPVHLQSSPSLFTFQQRLKTYLF